MKQPALSSLALSLVAAQLVAHASSSSEDEMDCP
jgi:hypothetical protein